MKIWYGTLFVATVILTSYIVIVIDRYIPAMAQNIALSQETLLALQEQIAKQNTVLESLQAEMKALSGNHGSSSSTPAAPPKPSLEEKRKAAIETLRSGLSKLTEAEAKYKQGDLNAAADLIKSGKQPLWQAGDVLTSHQDTLRALIPVIDVIMGQWKKGDKTADPSKVLTAVKTILQKLDSPS